MRHAAVCDVTPYRLDNRLSGSEVPGLLHARKLLTGHFNGDGRLEFSRPTTNHPILPKRPFASFIRTAVVETGRTGRESLLPIPVLRPGAAGFALSLRFTRGTYDG